MWVANKIKRSVLLAAAALSALSGCAILAPDGPTITEAVNRQRYVGKPISVIYQKHKREPYQVDQTANGRTYIWVFDNRYVYNHATGAYRDGPRLVYTSEQRVGGMVLGEYYYTDHDGIIRDLKYRYLR